MAMLRPWRGFWRNELRDGTARTLTQRNAGERHERTEKARRCCGDRTELAGMRRLWCWRCKEEVPMLDDAEFEQVRSCIHPEEMTTEKIFRDWLAEYERITGVQKTNPNIVWHHVLSLYGEPCRKCSKPLRSRRSLHGGGERDWLTVGTRYCRGACRTSGAGMRGWRERLGGDVACGKAAAEPPHSKGSWQLGWSSFYKTSHSAGGRGMGHPPR
jgi:hypothetical protein